MLLYMVCLRMDIFCPKTNSYSKSCHFVARKGKVRDFPEVGVQACSDCGMVTHSVDLSSNVDYRTGSMHRWSSEQKEIRSKPDAEIPRRMDSIAILDAKFGFRNILDWGCGAGAMLKAMQNSYTVSGLEPDEALRQSLIQEGLIVYKDSNEISRSGNRFDLVTLFHVIEHFYNAKEELERIRSVMSPNGVILIETPNANDALLTIYENQAFENYTYWSHHPMLHSQNSLQLLLENNGFSILENSGCQRYNLANHLGWLSLGKPGGHTTLSHLFTTETLKNYSRDLVSGGTSDTLWIVASIKS